MNIKLSPYRKFQVVAFSTMIIIFVLMYMWSEKNKESRIENARYTIGITTGTTHGLKTVFPFVDFYYFVKGKKYESTFDIDLEKYQLNTSGGRYIVRYSSKNAQSCELLYTCPIPDTIKVAPEEGWLSIPFKCE